MSQSPDTPETQRISMSVIDAVADAEGISPTQLSPPLYESINSEALDALIQNSDATVEFSYHDYLVRVESPDRVTVTPQTEMG